jgi:hypothetical protein
VFLASFYMTGDAAQWFTLLEKNQGTSTWDEFEKLVNQRFNPPICGNALGKLISSDVRRPSQTTRPASSPSSITARS